MFASSLLTNERPNLEIKSAKAACFSFMSNEIEL
jgi:hypothetical protein